MMIYCCPVCGNIRNTVGGEVRYLKISYYCKKCNTDIDVIGLDKVSGTDCPRCARGELYAAAEMLWD